MWWLNINRTQYPVSFMKNERNPTACKMVGDAYQNEKKPPQGRPHDPN